MEYPLSDLDKSRKRKAAGKYTSGLDYCVGVCQHTDKALLWAAALAPRTGIAYNKTR